MVGKLVHKMHKYITINVLGSYKNLDPFFYKQKGKVMLCFKGLKALKPDISVAATETRCHGRSVSLRKQVWKIEQKGSRQYFRFSRNL